MTRKIIINADDFGLCEGVNQGIVKAHTEGVLTSATLMTNMQCAEKAAALAKSLPSLGVGIHLNLTDGRPLAKDRGIGTLCNVNGEFAFNPYQLCSRSALSAKIREAIRMELQAQIQWTLDQGITPTHLDSHKHVHCFPVLFKIVCELAGRFGISAIRWPLEKQPKKECSAPESSAARRKLTQDRIHLTLKPPSFLELPTPAGLIPHFLRQCLYITRRRLSRS
jgi:predicted glycoside hydrolase/deacetylase ChbG (UPF0249 family)